MGIRLLIGDCRERLRELSAESVHCCVTSPPYFGLRDYGVDGQIGLEATPDAFVAQLVDVFREVRRVLRKDGTLWLNLGDSRQKGTGQLLGIPWRVALALQGDGWALQDEIIWSKPQTHPDPAKDRCTRSHEQVFMLSGGATYYFDRAAICEPSGQADRPQAKRALELANAAGLTEAHFAAIRSAGIADVGKAKVSTRGAGRNTPEVLRLAGEAKIALGGYYREFLTGETRNKRTVWTIPAEPFADAHFAVFPPGLIEPCILAGCPKGGTVLDPFGGAGTTGMVADRLGRNAILIELNPAYAAIAEKRLTNDAGMFADVSTEAA